MSTGHVSHMFLMKLTSNERQDMTAWAYARRNPQSMYKLNASFLRQAVHVDRNAIEDACQPLRRPSTHETCGQCANRYRILEASNVGQLAKSSADDGTE